MNRVVKFIIKKLNLFMFALVARKHGECSIPLSTEVKDYHSIHINGNFHIGEHCKLLCWDNYTHKYGVQRLKPSLTIGLNFRATRNMVIQCAGKIDIGDDVLLASNIFIIDYNHMTDPTKNSYLDGDLNVKNVYIGDGAWIGNNVIILPGAHIGKKSIIGAGSVVTGYIDDYCIAVGNPARVIRKWNFEECKWEKDR